MAEEKKKQAKKPHVITIELPVGVQAVVEQKYNITLKKGDTEVSRRLAHKQIQFSVEGNTLQIKSIGSSRTEYKMTKTYKAHIKNMIKGITEGHSYTLKICSGHFPMNIAVKDNKFEVKNFLGEKVPRVYKIRDGAKVDVKGDQVIIQSNSKELAGMTAAGIEQLTRIRKRDRRIFQDGIFITSKDGKSVS